MGGSLLRDPLKDIPGDVLSPNENRIGEDPIGNPLSRYLKETFRGSLKGSLKAFLGRENLVEDTIKDILEDPPRERNP